MYRTEETKRAKGVMRRLRSGGLGRWVHDHHMRKKNPHQLEWHALKSSFPHCNCRLENACQFIEDLLVRFKFVFSIYHSQGLNNLAWIQLKGSLNKILDRPFYLLLILLSAKSCLQIIQLNYSLCKVNMSPASVGHLSGLLGLEMALKVINFF